MDVGFAAPNTAGVGAIAKGAVAVLGKDAVLGAVVVRGLENAPNARRGLTTPAQFFGSRSADEAAKALEAKLGPARDVRSQAKTSFNPVTKRSFNIHTGPLHGDPHVDVKTRGIEGYQKYYLRQ